jgi:hypothetical protein
MPDIQLFTKYKNKGFMYVPNLMSSKLLSVQVAKDENEIKGILAHTDIKKSGFTCFL